MADRMKGQTNLGIYIDEFGDYVRATRPEPTPWQLLAGNWKADARREVLDGFIEEVRVPIFDNQADADAWLTVHDEPRQLYSEGTLVVWDREVDLWVSPTSGLVMPTQTVEFVGKVVAWRSEWRTTAPSGPPRYQLLTLAWQTEEPELVWVHAEEIKGLADG